MFSFLSIISTAAAGVAMMNADLLLDIILDLSTEPFELVENSEHTTLFEDMTSAETVSKESSVGPVTEHIKINFR